MSRISVLCVAVLFSLCITIEKCIAFQDRAPSLAFSPTSSLPLRTQQHSNGCGSSQSSCALIRRREQQILSLKCQSFEAGKQVLKFKEAETGVEVVIVGSMHYNPISIFRATQAVDSLADDDNLHAVIVESCPTRWKGSQKSMEGSTVMAAFLSNEMHAAAMRAQKRDIPVLLGDQKIEEITKKGGKMFKETISDLMSPLNQGWNRAGSDIAKAFSACFPQEDKSLSPSTDRKVDWGDALDPALIACLPITMVRYPLAWLVRGPRGFFTFMTATLTLSALPDLISAAVAASASDPVTTGGVGIDPGAASVASVLAGSAIAFAELVLVSRLMLVALLSERNSILADSIRAACIKSKEMDQGRAVVAVLGLAHVNGVQQLLVTASPPGSPAPTPAPDAKAIGMMEAPPG
mmetsp:Transcript_42621/g.100099  ORF Transcript_42621/g.100099 Transcript_42621/m.100099 type:complete len:407 (+) Transcript_42621:138-1358(+)